MDKEVAGIICFGCGYIGPLPHDCPEEQPPQADMVQPLVGPPDAGRLSEEPAALARRQLVAELKTFIKEEHESVDALPTDAMYADGARDAYDTVLEHLERLIGP